MPSGKMAVKGRLLQLVFVQVSVVLCLWSMQGTYAQGKSSWQTLSGKAPLVIARGGLSGLFPDQTAPAYQIAISNSLSDAVMFCDLQLTKDGEGICRTELNLENSTNIRFVFPNMSTYIVNGQNITGYFAIDYTQDVLLNNVTANQAVLSRPPQLNFPMLPPDALAVLNSSAIWLNVQYSKFYDEHNLSMPSYVRALSRRMEVDYISSTEVGFLRAIASNFRRSKTKLILRFLNKEDIDPSINQTYSSIIRNLTSVKTFASGILVPKSFIWPVGTDGYLQAPTSLVKDAHTSGLEIFAADFSSDEYGMSYNYSYDPVREYLQFVDNNNFAVDGILTDFSITASEAIACYAHNNVSRPSRAGNPLIISHNGASGDYPGSTDIAYQAAIRDGADYIDCSVQITKDGVPFCRESPDLMVGTAILSDSTYYPSLLRSIPEIQNEKGIFTSDLTWAEIQGLQKSIYSPFLGYELLRNPAEANMGDYMNLTTFLQFAKGQANVSVLINIENARAILSSRNLDVTNATLSALNISGYDNKTDRIMIQSDDSAVLLQFKQRTKFKLSYKVDEKNVAISNSSIKEIKTLADTVTLSRGVIFPSVDGYLLNATDVVSRMQSQNLSVFVDFLRNEFPSLAFDYFEDPTMEISSFVEVARVDGLITDFPATASAYLKNACRQSRATINYAMQIVDPGSLVTLAPVPAQAPAPALGEVIEPPLPPSLKVSPASEPSTEPQSPTSPTKSGSVSLTRHSLFVSLLIGLFILFFASY